MTLEDFFTLTEMKDGLSTLPRVEELVSAMKKQKDCVLDNGGDAARQWSTVVGTLAATENEDCLNHFVQLNGLCFLNQWLQESQERDKDVSDNVLDGSITSLLAVLERLPVDREKLTVSRIGVTVEHLLGHKSLDIMEKAKMLSDKWNNMRIDDVSTDYLVDRAASQIDQPKPSPDANTTEDGVHAICPILSVSPAKGGTGDTHCEVDSMGVESQVSNVTRCLDSSQVDTTTDVNISVTDKLAPSSSLNSADAGAGLGDLNNLASSLISNSCTEKSVTEESSVCPAIGLASAGTCSSPGYRVNDADQRDISEPREVSEGIEEMEVSTKEGSPCKSSRKESCIASPSSGLSASLPSSPVEDSEGSKEVDIATPSGSPKAEETKSGLGIEYEEIDALEVARQVALEVEREVVDYREPFCSSPEVDSGHTMDTHSPEGKQDQSLIQDLDGNKLPVEKDISDDASSPKDQKPQILESTVADPQEYEQPSESPKLASIARWDFDLNEDICTEEFNCSTNPIPDNQVNLSAPKAIVATSRGAPSLPVTPLQFEGEMGWKGSAATSAFRPASPRKTPDCEKVCSGLNKKQNFLEIDLNVADSEHDMAVDPPISARQLPVSSGLPSGDSSVEVCSRRAERLLKLDLNRLGDEDMPTNPSSYWRLNHQNGDQSLSSASSSSSRQPSMRDFDLNDNPCFFDVGGSSKVSTTNYGGSKLNDPVITIMGSRMAVERKDYLTQPHQSFLGNGLNMEAMMAARQAPPYAHMPPSYGYTMPIPPSFYAHGSIPYMVDSRGATVIPQILGPAGPNVTHCARPGFFTSGPPSSMNGAGPSSSRSGFDLNSCMTSVEGASREGGSFRQQFIHGHNGLMDEQTRIASQPSSSAMSLKRKEPECGWEPYAVGYKQMTWQ